MDGKTRSEIIGLLFEWFIERKHSIVFSAVDKHKFQESFVKELYAKDIQTVWRFMALHICLAIQKHSQNEGKNKGHSVLIFDNEESEKEPLMNLVKNPPDWTKTYYQCQRNQRQLDQIVDTPFFVDSRDIGLIQVADFISFFFRRYIELKMGIASKYEDEAEQITKWTQTALQSSISQRMMYMKRNRCNCADLFYRYAPSCVLQ